MARVGKVLVFLPFSPDHLDDVPPGFDFEVVDAVEAWPDSAADVEVYVPAYRFSTRVVEVLPSMPKLRVVQSLTAGVDHIAPLVPDRVTLCNAAGVHDASTAELAVGLMIAAQRELADHVRSQDRGDWQLRMTASLADSRVIVVGAGHIARAIQTRLAPMECETTLVGRQPRDGVRGVDELPDLLPAADIVTLAVPIDDTTRGLVDRGFLARMKPGALLVNVARGPVVVTADLVDAVARGHVRAALDVTDPEPLPSDHALWSLPGVIITPHEGGASDALWPRAHRLVAEQLRRLATGNRLLNVVQGPDVVRR
jgi:phosphoglycerate dehydrogenase-like enzyme